MKHFTVLVRRAQRIDLTITTGIVILGAIRIMGLISHTSWKYALFALLLILINYLASYTKTIVDSYHEHFNIRNYVIMVALLKMMYYLGAVLLIEKVIRKEEMFNLFNISIIVSLSLSQYICGAIRRVCEEMIEGTTTQYTKKGR